MTRNFFIFLGTFVAGALIALVVRAALFDPHAGHKGHPAGGGDYAAMVSNPLAPAKSASDPHASHDSSAAVPAAGKPVNTVCAICGMEVGPNAETAEYQGKTIAFGCKTCLPKFKANPDHYGPFYLRNEVIKK